MVRRRSASKLAAAGDTAAYPWTWALAIAAAAMVAIFAAAFFNSSELNPQGGWDAFAIWNLRARFLLQTDTWHYAVTAQSTGTHMEYPLLLSSLVARGWLYGGDTSQAVPAAIALFFSLAVAGILTSAVSLLRGTPAGLLAVCVLLANQFLISAAPGQYSDLPLACFFLAAAALLTLDRAPRGLTLAGTLAGFGAWTKNEGLLMLAVLVLVLGITGWRAGGSRLAISHTGLFLLGALPVLVLVLWFKLFVSPPDPLVGGPGGLRNLLDSGRWLHAALGFIKGLPVVALLILAFAAGLLRLRPSGERTPALFLPLLACVVMLAGDFAVFLLSRYDIEWLLSTALDRLYLQLWPLLVFGAFLLLHRPEDFAQQSAVPAPGRKAKGARRGR